MRKVSSKTHLSIHINVGLRFHGLDSFPKSAIDKIIQIKKSIFEANTEKVENFFVWHYIP